MALLDCWITCSRLCSIQANKLGTEGTSPLRTATFVTCAQTALERKP